MRYHIFVIGLIYGLCALIGGPGSQAQEAGVALKVREEFRSRLEYRKAIYASIFGLIPKEGPLELQEERAIVREQVLGEKEFRIQPLESKVRRVIRIPDELPLLENDPKPLTGRTLVVRQEEGRWKPEITDVQNPTPAESREAERLAARFAPDASPFVGLSGDATTECPLDLAKVLTFLGYYGPQEIVGKAIAGGDPVASGGGAEAGKFPLHIESMFWMGDAKEKISVELEARGYVSKSANDPDFTKLALEGKLVVAGKRDLPDGRRVPFNIIAEFDYTAERSSSTKE